MEKTLYFVKRNAFCMVISDDGTIRRVIIDNPNCNIDDQKERAKEFLQEIEDDSSWEEFNETVEELCGENDYKIIAKIETDI